MKITYSNRSGNITMIALFTMAILGVSLATYLKLTANQNVAIARSQFWNLQIPVAEAGIEEALTQLYYNGPTNLTANDWALSDGQYTKTRFLDTNSYFVAKISADANAVVTSWGYVRQPLKSEWMKPRAVRVYTRRDGMFMKGMVAKGQIDLSGNNVSSDSFDSLDPAFSNPNGSYNPLLRKDNGDIATNSGLTNSFAVGNANIRGRVATGPGGTMSIGANGIVGNNIWVLNPANSGKIQPGWSTDDMNVSFPDVLPPFSSGAVGLINGNVGGTNYTFFLDGGNYQQASISMAGQQKMYVTNANVLYVTGDFSMAGQTEIRLAPGAKLKLYVGGSASLAGNGIINNGSALDFSYWGLNSNTSLSFSGNAAFNGTIYAPYAAFTLGGGGNNTEDFVGASVSSSVKMNGKFNFHYDENLGRNGPRRGYIVTNWFEL